MNYKVETKANGYGISLSSRYNTICLGKTDLEKLINKDTTFNEFRRSVIDKLWEIARSKGVANDLMYPIYEFDYCVKQVYNVMRLYIMVHQ